MNRLRPIVDVREVPPACAKLRQSLPSLRSLVREVAEPHESKLLDYLRQGVVCGVYNDRGLIHDVLTPGERIEPDANLLMTDGTWIWPKALVHYLCKYHIRIPAAFVTHAERNDWRIDPSSVQLETLNIDAFDAPASELGVAHTNPGTSQEMSSTASTS